MSVEIKKSFYSLSPEVVLTAAETFGIRATGRFEILPSYENRVYQVELEEPLSYTLFDEDGEVLEKKEATWIVGKFYRPERWSLEALLEEHSLTERLYQREVPVTPWLKSESGTVGKTESGIYFGFTPRVFGRPEPEPNLQQIEWLGRLLGRMHSVLRGVGLKHRSRFGSEALIAAHESICGRRWMHDAQADRLRQYVDILKLNLDKYLSQPHARIQSIHGDCHFGNLLWNQSGPFFLDFDDAMTGPIAQDLWLILEGAEPIAQEKMLEGYASMGTDVRLNSEDLAMFRSYRMIQFAGWVAKRFDDPAFQRVFPQYKDSYHWQRWLEDYARVWDQT